MTWGIIVSYRILLNNRIKYFLNTTTKDWFVSLNVLIPEVESQWPQMENCLPRQILRDICYNICHKFVFSPEYMWSLKVKILCLSTISEVNRWLGRVNAYMRQWTRLRKWISIGSGNDWSPARRQVITQSHPDLFSIASLRKFFSEIKTKFSIR